MNMQVVTGVAAVFSVLTTALITAVWFWQKAEFRRHDERGQELHKDVRELRREFTTIRDDLRYEVGTTRDDLRREVGGIQTNLRHEFQATRADSASQAQDLENSLREDRAQADAKDDAVTAALADISARLESMPEAPAARDKATKAVTEDVNILIRHLKPRFSGSPLAAWPFPSTSPFTPTSKEGEGDS